MLVNLRHLEILYGVIGAREKFEDMTVQLIRSENPSVDRVRVFRGDGGIDAFDGGLTDPSGVDVYQVKYFPEKIDDSQKNQIRDSFKRVRENTDFVTRSWTLCLPIDMSIEERKWLDDWKSKQAGSGITIRPVWGATKIQSLLLMDENRNIRESFFQQENPQQLREMSDRLQKILNEITDRIPKPEPILLEPHLETVNLKTVEAGSQGSACVVLRAHFCVTNKSGKTARIWTVKCEFVPSSQAVADRLRTYPNTHSGNVILPSQTNTQNIEFGFHVRQQEGPPFALLFRSLMMTSVRFHAISEDFVGESQTVTIGQVADSIILYSQIENALRNAWFGG
jgi:hypothetical protein